MEKILLHHKELFDKETISASGQLSCHFCCIKGLLRFLLGVCSTPALTEDWGSVQQGQRYPKTQRERNMLQLELSSLEKGRLWGEP